MVPRFGDAIIGDPLKRKDRLQRLFWKGGRTGGAATAALVVVAAFFQPVTAGALEDLERYYLEVETLQGRFEQFTLDERDQLVDESSGEFVIARPDRFHWSYTAPFRQEIVADGERLWIFDVELDQVTVHIQGGVLGSAPVQLLSGDYAGLEEAFEILPEDGFIRLLPRDPDQAFDQARLGFRDGAPVALEVDDALGQTTRVEFVELQVNAPVDADRFRFEPPPGADVYSPEPGVYP